MPHMLSEDTGEPVNIMWFGDSGTGKTTAMAAMANLGRIWMLDCESGIKRRALQQQGIDVSNIEVFPSPGEEISFRSVEAEWLRIREELAKDPEVYVGVCWDSVTELAKLILDRVVAKAVVSAERAGKERDQHFIGLEDYGGMTERMRSLVRKFRDLPCHFAVSALQRRDQDPDGSVTYLPAVTPKLGIDIVGWMDVICATSIATVDGEDEYRGLFRPSGTRRGKDRLGVLPKWLVDPTFDRVNAYVDGSLTVDTDPVMEAARIRAAREREKVGAAA